MQAGVASAARPFAPSRARRRVWPLLPLLLVALLPVLPGMNNYILAVTVRALIFIALGQAWNIVAGIGGQLSLGHGVFLGLGCYVAGILFNDLGLPWLGVPAGMGSRRVSLRW